MDNREFDLLRRKRIENVVLVICTIYSVFVAAVTYATPNAWITYIIEGGVLILWMVHLTEFKSYRFRAGLCAAIASLCILVYCVFVNSEPGALIAATGFSIVIGLYELQGLLVFPLVSVSLIILHHLFISKTLALTSLTGASRTILEIISIYVTILVVKFFIDEEERNKVRLLDTIDELKLAERSKDDFLANMSHELRTPINTICGMSEIAISEAKSETTREHLTDIKNAGRSLMTVVNDILDYSEISSGRFTLDEDKYNISSTINDVLNLSLARIGDKKLELILNCDPMLPSSLRGDEPKLKRIMLNLIDNAIKYTQEGYVIIDISGRNEDYGINLCVRIRDTGIGMRPESLNRIFSDFTQLNSGRDRKQGGIGLGLTIVRYMVELMGGFMTVDSKYGKGTDIQFTIPQTVVDSSPIGAIDKRLVAVNIENVAGGDYGDSAVRITGKSGSGAITGQMIMPNAHIMIVDDSFMNLKVIEGLLKPYKIKITTAGSGREALEKLVSRDYDFIFMDHMMPEMDGIETVRRIRDKDIAYYKEVPIIALTANAVAGAKEMFMENGFNDFISKPVEVGSLERILKKYISSDKISYSDIDDATGTETENAAGNLVIGDLDVKKGLLYCGTVDNYMNVLKVHATNGPENIDRIRKFFADGDYENYTIYVHALKSSMASIGADVLSKMAKDMEQAAKDRDIPYIEAYHEEMMKEYERVISLLLGQDTVQMEVSDEFSENVADPIDDDKFDKYVNDFEDAAYTFVADDMLKILDELKEFSYNGHPLAPQLIAIRRKVEMSDYMSAADALSSIRERYRNR